MADDGICIANILEISVLHLAIDCLEAKVTVRARCLCLWRWYCIPVLRVWFPAQVLASVQHLCHQRRKFYVVSDDLEDHEPMHMLPHRCRKRGFCRWCVSGSRDVVNYVDLHTFARIVHTRRPHSAGRTVKKMIASLKNVTDQRHGGTAAKISRWQEDVCLKPIQ